MKLAIHIESGTVQRVESDSNVLDQMEVAVLVDHQPARLLRPMVEAAVTQYVETARSPELCHSLALTCQAIGRAFADLAAHQSSDALPHLEQVEAKLAQARHAVETAKREVGWQAQSPENPLLRALATKQ
ncbi:MAG: hypothetical protein ACR2PA_05095 [Hyphomicrobiaceae bacterium]